MELEEKYNLHIIEGRRYYKFNLFEKLPHLEETIPYCFKYRDIKIYDGSWNKMAVKILTALDSKMPHDESWYLSFRYFWSNIDVFSTKKRTNFTPFKNIFLNTNHTATHSMMSIQTILNNFGVNLEECTFLIKKHQIAEPKEVKEFYREKTISDFKKYLHFIKVSDNHIEKIISNFNILNKFLSRVSVAFGDFFLFDDYSYFCSYKSRVINEAKEVYWNAEKRVDVVCRTLDYLDDFYKNYVVFEKFMKVEDKEIIKHYINKEIAWLFKNLEIGTIVNEKLFARMSMMRASILKRMSGLDNPKDFFVVAKLLLGDTYYFQYPYICINKDCPTNTEDILLRYIENKKEFTIEELNSYLDKAYFKKPSPYLSFIIKSSENFVQISLNKYVRKELLDLTNDKIEKIYQEIKFYISSFGKINTLNYIGYASLPILKYTWNPYFLVGIIRSFLPDKITINYASSSWKNYEFVLELKK